MKEGEGRAMLKAGAASSVNWIDRLKNMGEKPSKLAYFLAELRRRHVFRVAVGYAAFNPARLAEQHGRFAVHIDKGLFDGRLIGCEFIDDLGKRSVKHLQAVGEIHGRSRADGARRRRTGIHGRRTSHSGSRLSAEA